MKMEGYGEESLELLNYSWGNSKEEDMLAAASNATQRTLGSLGSDSAFKDFIRRIEDGCFSYADADANAVTEAEYLEFSKDLQYEGDRFAFANTCVDHFKSSSSLRPATGAYKKFYTTAGVTSDDIEKVNTELAKAPSAPEEKKPRKTRLAFSGGVGGAMLDPTTRSNQLVNIMFTLGLDHTLVETKHGSLNLTFGGIVFGTIFGESGKGSSDSADTHAFMALGLEIGLGGRIKLSDKDVLTLGLNAIAAAEHLDIICSGSSGEDSGPGDNFRGVWDFGLYARPYIGWLHTLEEEGLQLGISFSPILRVEEVNDHRYGESEETDGTRFKLPKLFLLNFELRY